jgi:hypothetical protein
MTHGEEEGPSWNEAKAQWGRINARLLRDMPSLNEALSRAIAPGSGLSSFGESPYAQFVRYLQALDDVCQQAVYAMERLPLLIHKEWSNPWELLVKHYLYDSVSRVKTSLDLMALALNVLFDLRLDPRDCSLEKGKICGQLRTRGSVDDPHRDLREQLAVSLDQARTDWIVAFYHLRNLAIHRNGLTLAGARDQQTGKSYIFLVAGGLLDVADEREVVERVVKQLGLLDDPLTLSSAIEPLNMCQQLWVRLADLVNSVLDQSMPQIGGLVSNEHARSKETPLAGNDAEPAGQRSTGVGT